MFLDCSKGSRHKRPFKGYIWYIFAISFFKSKKEDLWNYRNFLLLFQFKSSTVSLADKFKAWNWTGRYYARYRRLLNKFQILAWLTKAKNHGSNPLQFSSWKLFLNFKTVLQGMKTRFFICMWFFRINKRFLTILFHKNTKIITHSW